MHIIWKLIVILVICLLLINYLPSILPERIRDTNLDLPLMFLKKESLLLGSKIAYGPEVIDIRDQDWGKEHWRMAISLPESNGFINQYIYRFRNELGAIYEQKVLKTYFTFYEGNDKEIKYLSPVADVWDVTCEEISVSAGRCTVFSRYDEIIGILLLTYKNDTYTVEEINQLIKSFDLQISHQLVLSNQ